MSMNRWSAGPIPGEILQDAAANFIGSLLLAIFVYCIGRAFLNRRQAEQVTLQRMPHPVEMAHLAVEYRVMNGSNRPIIYPQVLVTTTGAEDTQVVHFHHPNKENFDKFGYLDPGDSWMIPHTYYKHTPARRIELRFGLGRYAWMLRTRQVEGSVGMEDISSAKLTCTNNVWRRTFWKLRDRAFRARNAITQSGKNR